MKNFYDLTQQELQEYLVGHGSEKFRGQQLFRWVYQQGVTDFSMMSNLAKDFRARLPEILEFKLPGVVQQLDSSDGTRKFLMKVEGEKNIESVLIPNGNRLTLCVSSKSAARWAVVFVSLRIWV